MKEIGGFYGGICIKWKRVKQRNRRAMELVGDQSFPYLQVKRHHSLRNEKGLIKTLSYEGIRVNLPGGDEMIR